MTDVPPFRRIAIVGAGLIGGSLGLAVKRRWPSARIVAIDRPEVARAALAMGAADAGADDVSAAASADLVVLSAPVGVNVSLLGRVESLGGHGLITDTGSTKRDIAGAAADSRFIGGHPIAGAATPGIQSARADLFAGRPWILTPAPGAAIPPALQDLLDGVGARVRVMTPDAHDRVLSAVSHLPQLAASALMHVIGAAVGDDGLALAGAGLRDTTRLAASPADIWRDVACANRDHLGRDLDALIAALQALRDDLDSRNAALTRTFESAARWRRAVDRQFDG
jgi:prephenate dehydrogenase